MAFPPSRGLVSPCLPLSPIVSLQYTFVLDGVSAFPRSCLSLSSSIVSHLPSCFPFLDGVPTCPPLFPILSHCLPTCVPALPTSYLPLSPIASPNGLSGFPMLVSELSPIVPPCVPVLDGASAFPRFCLPLSPIVSHTCACVGWCVRLFDVLSSLFVSHCLPTCVPVLGGVLSCLPVLDGVSAFPRSCLPLSPIVSSPCAFVLDGVSAFPRPCLPFCLPPPFLFPLLGWCARLFKVLSPLISHCSIFSIVSPQVCLCWRVCPPSRGLVSPCLPSCLSLSPVVSNCFALSAIVSTCPTLSPNMCACVGWSTFPKSCFSSSPIVSLDMRACVGWCVRLPEVLSPLVSPHVCLCWLVPQPWMVCPPSRGIVSPCLPVLDGLSASPRSCLHLSSIVSHCPANCLPLSPFLSPRLPLSPVAFHCFPVSPHMCACAGWCVRLPRSCLPIVSHCLPNWCLCWMVSPAWIISAFKRPCLPMSPIVSPHVCLCWMLCPPSRGLVSFCLPLFPHMCACNVLCGMVLQLSRGFVSPLVSHCLPSCFPVLDGVSAFPRFCLPCLPACLLAGLPSCLQACLPTCLSSRFPLWWVV